MGVRFTAASSQFFTCATVPFTTAPFTVALWFNGVTFPSGGANLFSWEASTVSTDNVLFHNTSSGLGMWDGTNSTTLVASPVANRWYFILMRMISSTNCRGTVVDSTGLVTHVATVTATPATAAHYTLGANDAGAAGWIDGYLAEFWIMDKDIVPDGGAMTDTLARQLAFSGIFSYPPALPNLVDYRSMKSSLVHNCADRRESFVGKYGRVPWTVGGSPIVSIHPPLLGGYKGPPGTRSSPIIPI